MVTGLFNILQVRPAVSRVYWLHAAYENGFVRVEMGFEITTESDNEQKEANAEFNFSYMFEVENLKELVELKKKMINDVNSNLVVALAAISFSTSRGILMTRLQGTAMEDYILKIIAPEDLLKEDTFYS